MNSLVTDAFLKIAHNAVHDARDRGEAMVNMDVDFASVALAELQQHRHGARARGALPMFVPGQPGEGEMVAALDELAVFVSDDPDDEHLRAAEKLIRGVIREVLHLRQHVTHAQTVARGERDRRMAAETNVAKLTLQRDALTMAVLKLHEAGATSPDVAIVNRTPLWEPPVADRSDRWREAQDRIEAATSAGKDAAQADMDIVLEEHLKHLGFPPDT